MRIRWSLLLLLAMLGRPSAAAQPSSPVKANGGTVNSLPRLVEIRYRGGALEIEFTSSVDPAQLSPVLEVDDQTKIWNLGPDGKTLRLREEFPAGRRWVTVTPWGVTPRVIDGRYRKAYPFDPKDGDQVLWSLRDRSDRETANLEAAEGGDGTRFVYDAADNLLEVSTVDRGVESRRQLPLDDSGRNRPSSVAGVALEWDANGNLIRKGDLRIAYDWQNKPVLVRQGTTPLVEFAYDPFRRLIRAEYANGELVERSWDGW